jgi:ABC-type amino acid transport substrate-binding protein
LTNKKDGFTTGYDKDVLELINKITDTNFQLVTGTWKEMLEKAINKEIDGLSTSVVYKEREKYFYFSDTYTNTQKYLITLDINPKDIYNIDDFAGKRIAYHQDNLFRKDYPSKILKNSIRNTDTLARWGG